MKGHHRKPKTLKLVKTTEKNHNIRIGLQVLHPHKKEVNSPNNNPSLGKSLPVK